MVTNFNKSNSNACSQLLPVSEICRYYRKSCFCCASYVDHTSDLWRPVCKSSRLAMIPVM